MKRASIHITEWIYSLSFLLYLFGSSLAHREQGTELSLWLMTFAIALTALTTLLPMAGIRWLRLEQQGSQRGYWIAMLLQVLSWFSFAWAMLLRLGRNIPLFQTWITITTLLWATWLLMFLFSRHGHSD